MGGSRFAVVGMMVGLGLSAGDAALVPTPQPLPWLGFAPSGSLTFGSQYLFRGLTQTDGNPTIQGALDLVHPSGFYFSASLSNMSWYTDQNAGLASHPTSLGSPGRVGGPLYKPNSVNSAGVELDLFGGYRWGLNQNWTLDLGLYRYLYPGTYENQGAYRNPSTTETYLGVSNTWINLKYSSVLSVNTFGVSNAKGTSYLEVSLNLPLGAQGWALQAHGGRTTYRANPNPDYFMNGATLTGDNSLFSYSDFKLGMAKVGHDFTLSAFWTYANTKARASDNEVTVYENASGRNIGGNRVTVTLSRSF